MAQAGRVGGFPMPHPTTQAAVQEANASGLCGRVFPYWRISAGIVCLVASVVAVCCAIVWNTHWLCLPFGLSSLASGYTIYLGYEFHNLKTFEKSNAELRGSLSHLNKENIRLEKTAQAIQQANLVYEELIKRLQDNIKDLEQLRDNLLIKAAVHVENLKRLQDSLNQIHLSAAENHKTFETDVEVFSTHLKNLSQSNSELSATCSKLDGVSSQLEELTQRNSEYSEENSKAKEAMIKQTEALIEAGKKIQDIFIAIQKWKDLDTNRRQVEEIERLQRLIYGAHHELQQATEKLGDARAQVDSLKVQVSELKKIKAGFNIALDSLLEKIKLLEQERIDLSQVRGDIEKAAEVFQKYKVEDA